MTAGTCEEKWLGVKDVTQFLYYMELPENSSINREAKGKLLSLAQYVFLPTKPSGKRSVGSTSTTSALAGLGKFSHRLGM